MPQERIYAVGLGTLQTDGLLINITLFLVALPQAKWTSIDEERRH